MTFVVVAVLTGRHHVLDSVPSGQLDLKNREGSPRYHMVLAGGITSAVMADGPLEHSGKLPKSVVLDNHDSSLVLHLLEHSALLRREVGGIEAVVVNEVRTLTVSHVVDVLVE